MVETHTNDPDQGDSKQLATWQLKDLFGASNFHSKSHAGTSLGSEDDLAISMALTG